MKILFIGSVYFSKSILNNLIKKKFNICGVISKKKSNFNSDFFNLSSIAKKKNIECKLTKNINLPTVVKWIKKKEPDILLCCGWSQLISKEILEIPKKYCIGYHPSDLPSNKGRHPIIWSLILGLNRCGSSFFLMDQFADSGKVLSKKFIKIEKKDNATSLYKKLNKVAVIQSERLLTNILNQKLSTKSKVKFNKGNVWRKRSFRDGEIDWRMTAKSIANLVKALSYPYPNAHFTYHGQIFKVLDAEVEIFNIKNIEPGKVLNIKKKGQFTVRAGEDAIVVKKTIPKITIKSDYIL